MRRFSCDFGWGLVVGAATVCVLTQYALAGAAHVELPVVAEPAATSARQVESGDVGEATTTADTAVKAVAAGESQDSEASAVATPSSAEVPTSVDKSTNPANLDGLLEAAPLETDEDPAWIRRIRYTDTDTSTDYLVIEGGGHGKLSDCEADFELQLVEVARKYIDQVVGQSAWKTLDLTPETLRPYLIEDHEYIKTRQNEFGVTYLKYGQFGFTEEFRSWVRVQHRQAQQQNRLQLWMVGAGGLIGLLALATVVLKTRGRCCR